MREKGLLSRGLLIFSVILDSSNRESRFFPLSFKPLLCHFDSWEKSLVRQWGEISRFARNDNQRLLLQFLLRSWGSALGAAEAEGPEGRAQAEMVLGPFAETKGPRWWGRNPAFNNSC